MLKNDHPIECALIFEAVGLPTGYSEYMSGPGMYWSKAGMLEPDELVIIRVRDSYERHGAKIGPWIMRTPELATSLQFADLMKVITNPYWREKHGF